MCFVLFSFLFFAAQLYFGLPVSRAPAPLLLDSSLKSLCSSAFLLSAPAFGFLLLSVPAACALNEFSVLLITLQQYAKSIETIVQGHSELK